MKLNELKTKNKSELIIELKNARMELFKLKLNKSKNRVDSDSILHSHTFKAIRRKIACIMTILSNNNSSGFESL